MKRFFFLVLDVLLFATFFSCVTTAPLEEGEELVEYKDLDYTVQNKSDLTEEELRQDCDMLKYILYTVYAGIDEAIENGFDLDTTIEQIYSEAAAKKSLGKISSGDFSTAIYSVMSKNLNNTDQHLSIGGHSIKAQYAIYYTNIWMEKRGDKFFVKEIKEEEVENKKNKVKAQENADVKPGMEFTGPVSNLYEFISPNGLEYRYGVYTNKNVRTVQISLENKNYQVPTSNEKPVNQKYVWTGIKNTTDTLYMSLGDCTQINGKTNDSNLRSLAWDKYLAKINDGAKDKKNIIFDLRSNPGGYYEYPAKMLTAAFYYKHQDKEELDNIRALFSNTITQGCTRLASPFSMQGLKKIYEEQWSDQFELLPEEIQEFYKSYWKHMKRRPLRKQIPLNEYKCNLTEFPEPDFKGDVYILINRKTASASEFGTGMAYLLKDKGINVHLVGENSMGAFKYAGMNYILLPNSSIGVYCGNFFGESPYIKENQNWKGEGYGFKPDYYATNDRILSTLILLTKDLELADTLRGLDKEQL